MDSIFRNAAGQYPTKMSNKLTDDIRAQFKSARGLEKKRMNEVLLGFIHEYIAKKKPLRPLAGRRGNKVRRSP